MAEGIFILGLLTAVFFLGRYLLKQRETKRAEAKTGGGGGRPQPK